MRGREQHHQRRRRSRPARRHQRSQLARPSASICLLNQDDDRARERSPMSQKHNGFSLTRNQTCFTYVRGRRSLDARMHAFLISHAAAPAGLSWYFGSIDRTHHAFCCYGAHPH